MNVQSKLSKRILFLIPMISILMFDCSKKEEVIPFVDYTELAIVCGSSDQATSNNFEFSGAKVALIIRGEPHEWNELLPPSIKPLKTNEVDVIGCVTERGETIETCEYGPTGGFFVTRISIYTSIDLFNKQTGELLISKEFKGREPVQCPVVFSFNTQNERIVGEAVEYREDIEVFLLTGL